MYGLNLPIQVGNFRFFSNNPRIISCYNIYNSVGFNFRNSIFFEVQFKKDGTIRYCDK